MTKYAFCDWLIYRLVDGRVEYTATELWEEWLDLPEDADQEEDLVTYMWPLVLAGRECDWQQVVDPEELHETQSLEWREAPEG